MKRVFLILGILLMWAGLQAQDSTNPSLLRSSKAIDALNTVPYAWLYFQNEAATVTVAAEDTYYTISQGDTLWNNGTTQRMTLTNDTLYADIDGDYTWNLSTSYFMTAGDTIVLAVKHNSTVYRVCSTSSVGAEVITAGGAGILPSVDDGDTIIVQVQNANDNTNISLLDGSFLFRLIRYD